MLNLLDSGNLLTTSLLATTLFAAVLAYLRNAPNTIFIWIKSQFTVSIIISEKTSAYEWVSYWLNAHPYTKKARRLELITKYEDDDEWNPQHKDKPNRPTIVFTPAKGQHLLSYKGRYIWLNHSAENVPQGTMQQKQSRNYELSVTGRDQSFLRELLNEIMLFALPEGEPATFVTCSAYGSWNNTITKKPRSRNSVILPENTLNNVIDDIKEFLTKTMDRIDVLFQFVVVICFKEYLALVKHPLLWLLLVN